MIPSYIPVTISTDLDLPNCHLTSTRTVISHEYQLFHDQGYFSLWIHEEVLAPLLLPFLMGFPCGDL